LSRQPSKFEARFELRLEGSLRDEIALCGIMDGKSDSEWLRGVVRRAVSRRLRRSSGGQFRAATAKLNEQKS